MIAIGIPTYNEADNISSLVTKISLAAQENNLNVVFVNADSASEDTSVKVFNATKTPYKKVSIRNKKRGKGHNIFSILKWVDSNKDIRSCIFIDADITSFETEWLVKYAEALSQGNDYVIPVYSRNYEEGNTTNHFVYPLIGMHLGDKTPRQPISGDFGVSRRFAKHLLRQSWNEHAFAYGVDIFMTLHALYGGFFTSEISLSKKLHKPSFEKMISMFEEVSSSYYQTMKTLGNTNITKKNVRLKTQPKTVLLSAKEPINALALNKRRDDAHTAYDKNSSLIPNLEFNSSSHLDERQWIQILICHEKMIPHKESAQLTQSILPWYLLRVVSYLESTDNPKSADVVIANQFDLAVEEWQSS